MSKKLVGLLTTTPIICSFLAQNVSAQSNVLIGNVQNENGKAISSANIKISKSNKNVHADEFGNFQIIAPDSTLLTISALGYKDTTVKAFNGITISLRSAINDLSEVVVTGYGTQKRSQITGSIATVKSEALENVPFTSVDKTLQGKVAGVNSSQSNGQPGSSQSVIIRGVNSYSASTQPLYVVDGVQMNSGDLSSMVSTSNPLSNINPNDIESVTVLKDAAAAAIYGSRGSNGVIIITTKSGKSGKTQIRFDAELGKNNIANLPAAGKPMNASDWFTLLQEGMTNAGYTSSTIATTMAKYGYGNGVDIDWLKLTTQNGQQQQYNLSMNGGDAKTQFYMSGGYFKQQGVNVGSDLRRITGTIKLNHKVNDKLSINTNWTVGNVFQNTPLSAGGYYANPWYVALTLRPTQNPYHSDGTLNIDNNDTGFTAHYNPLYLLKYDKHYLKSTQIVGGIEGVYKIINGLKFTSHLGLQNNAMEEFTYYNPYYGSGKSYNGYSDNIYSRYFLWDWYNQFDYHLDITKDKHFSVDVKAGYEAIKNTYYKQNSEMSSFPPNADLVYSTNAATALSGSVYGSNYTFASMYGNALISYDDRYALTFSLRRDGSSRFSENNRYGIFPSFGFNWNVKNEKFLQDVQVLDVLKLRTSYGSSGNAQIGNYAWRQTYSYGYSYNGVAGGTFSSIGNSNLTWEKNKQFDIGLDLGILNNRITITTDFYNKQSSGLLFSKPLSMTTGFATITSNVGKLQNRGIEFSITGIPIQTKNFTWTSTFNIAHNRNKILSLPSHSDIQNGVFLLREGHDIQSFYLKGWSGVDVNTGDAMYFTDSTRITNTSTYANAATQLLNKSASPKYFGMFSNTVNYKGIYLSADIYYNFGNYIYDSYGIYFLGGGYPTRGRYAENKKAWKQAGDVTTVAKYVYGKANTAAGERLLYRGDYMRLRNVMVGFKMDKKNYSFMQKAGISSLNIYARGTNLLTKTYDKEITFDPEQGTGGTNSQGLLNAKSFTFGLNLGF